MLSKIVVSLYAGILEVGLWLILIAGVVIGWQMNDFLGAILGLVCAALFGAVFFGAFFVISDIRTAVRNIESKK